MNNDESRSLKVLDCTLRDGGYINNWHFPQLQILSIFNALEESNIEIIELGYLDDNGQEKNSTLFSSTTSIDNIIKNPSKAMKVVMINLFDYDIDKLIA